MALELQAAVQQHREAQHRYLEQRDQVRAMLLARQLGPAGSPERAAQLARLKALKLQLAAAQQRQHELRAAREARLQHHQMQVQQGLLPQQPLQAAPAPQPAPLPYQQMLPGGDPAGLLAFQAAAAPLGPPPPLPPSAGLLASAAGGPMPPLGHAQPLPQAAGMPPLPTQRQRGLYEQPSLRPELEASSSMAGRPPISGRAGPARSGRTGSSHAGHARRLACRHQSHAARQASMQGAAGPARAAA